MKLGMPGFIAGFEGIPRARDQPVDQCHEGQIDSTEKTPALIARSVLPGRYAPAR